MTGRAVAFTAAVVIGALATGGTLVAVAMFTLSGDADRESSSAVSAGPEPPVRSGPPDTSEAPAATATPMPEPVPVVHYTFPISGCAVDYVAEHHHYPATDMFAARGCAFVAPVAGTIDEVNRQDAWNSSTNVGAERGGLFVSLVGVDGVRYYGSHLESVDAHIRPGVRVDAGRRLGAVGDTGSAAGTGPHLHFGISWPTPPDHWWVRRGAVPPARHLNAWRAGETGRAASPSGAVAEARAEAGDFSRCATYC